MNEPVLDMDSQIKKTKADGWFLEGHIPFLIPC